VPAEFTSGSARQTSPPAHGDATIAPPTHCASASPAHCTAVVLHASPDLSAANCWLSAIAASPFAERRAGCQDERQSRRDGRTLRKRLGAGRVRGLRDALVDGQRCNGAHGGTGENELGEGEHVGDEEFA
jgi:hypothetical protein